MRVLFVLLRTLGDCILINTLVNCLEGKYPDWEITVIVNQEYRDIVIHNPNIPEVISLPAWDDVLKEMVSEKYDKVLCPYQTTPEDNVWHHLEKYRHQHLIDYYAKRCGIKEIEHKCYMYPQEDDFKFAKEKYDSLGSNGIVAIHTTTLVPEKDWQGFEELNKRLKDFRVVQVGSETDKPVESAFNLLGQFTLNQLAAFLSMCKCFIGLDSGVSYIADAMNCPTVCLMGSTVPTTSGPIGKDVKFILAKTRPECEKQRCHAHCRFKKPCINNILVGEVEEAVRRITDK